MYKPKLHVTPSKNWMNDPNGFIDYNGEFHLFYQHYPYEPQWGTMHWGHLTSKDLIHFADHGIALYPSKDYDRNGCFSGSAIEKDGKMYIYYTAVYYDEINPEDIHRTANRVVQSQAMLISEDGYHFNNNLKKQIIPWIKDENIGDFYDTRDPKVLKIDDTYYMVLGTKHNEQGRVLVYSSKDAINWELLSINDDPQGRLGDMVECPDLYCVNGQWIMTLSPMHTHLDGINYHSHCQNMLVDFDPQTGKITFLSDPWLIDQGMDYYAAQSTKDHLGNQIIIGWMRMAAPSNGWNGLFTFPRIMEYKDDHLYYHLYPTVYDEFKEEVNSIDTDNAYYISCDVKEGSTIDVAGMKIKVEDHQIKTDRSNLMVEAKNSLGHRNKIGTTFTTPAICGDIHLDIFIDQNIIEIYVNDGYYVLSNIIYNQTSEFKTSNVDHIMIKKAR